MDDPEEVKALMAPELTGWRRYARGGDGPSPMGELPARARFFPDEGVDGPLARQPLIAGITTYRKNGFRGFARLVHAVAARFGQGAFDAVEAVFAAEGIGPQELRAANPPELRGWYWSS